MWQSAVFALRILMAVPGAVFLVPHSIPHGLAQNGGMTDSGCMGMNGMGTSGAGMMRGMGGSMPRHHQFMMGGIPEPYASMVNPLPDTVEVVARGRAVFEQTCASCHGAERRGRGEAGRELSPPPADLADLVGRPLPAGRPATPVIGYVRARRANLSKPDPRKP